MNTNYKKLCRQLETALKSIGGVHSVGLGKKEGRVVLVVAVDAELYRGGIPEEYRGMEVVVRKLGLAKVY